ncbi:MAG TPA: tripartite tricarboxylate transporter substrate binding protein [Burkholderiales bacterium]|nr:tripartite tricarboxylate transporter substrate binding protein [Burkholderiales bacterium]
MIRLRRCAAIVLPLAGAAQAADYPERPVRVIVTFPAGGGTDIVARMIFQKVIERTGGSYVIDNRGGAGGTIGTEQAAKATADGYTIVVVSGSHTINPALYKKLAYDAARDFAPISMLVSGPGLLVVHPSLPARSVKELIAVAKSRPGELLYASPGNGTPPHLAAELFKSMAGVNLVHVPYKGNAQAMTDLIAGQESLSFPTGPSAMPHVQTKRLRALGVTSAKRAAGLPDIPTIAESGLPGYDASAWYGVLAPVGTPTAIIAKLQSEIHIALRSPDIVDKLAAQGLEPAPNNADEFARFIAAELAKWNKIIPAAGIKVE